MPLVIAVDASVTGDCSSLVVVSRYPKADLGNHIVERYSRIWTPKDQPGGQMDYDATFNPEIDYLIANHNVVEVAYDSYQLHQWAVNRRKETTAWYREFSQGADRMEADKGLFDLIRDRRLHHTGNPELRQHVQNANAKHDKLQDTKMRLVKKAETRKIDGAVALSMASAECLRLNL